ncbi:MAG: hypothetical protein IPG50_24910 [Myxococcales bacterium]|nr:hypothetical protein [Myxococcales bacterium]
MAKLKKSNGPFERLTDLLRESPPVPVDQPFDAAALEPLYALARAHDRRVVAFLETLATLNTSFHLYDIEMFPAQLLRGKRGEAWNAGASVVTEDDVCLAKNGAGDIYVWHAPSGKVRFLQHDKGWAVDGTFRNVDEFVEHAMSQVVELLEEDSLDDADDAMIAGLRFALSVAGDESLDDDARAKLVDLRVMKA